MRTEFRQYGAQYRPKKLTKKQIEQNKKETIRNFITLIVLFPLVLMSIGFILKIYTEKEELKQVEALKVKKQKERAEEIANFSTVEMNAISMTLLNQYLIIHDRADITTQKKRKTYLYQDVDYYEWEMWKMHEIDNQCKALVDIIMFARDTNETKFTAILMAIVANSWDDKEYEWNKEVLQEPEEMFNQFHADWVEVHKMLQKELGMPKKEFIDYTVKRKREQLFCLTKLY